MLVESIQGAVLSRFEPDSYMAAMRLLADPTQQPPGAFTDNRKHQLGNADEQDMRQGVIQGQTQGREVVTHNDDSRLRQETGFDVLRPSPGS